VSSATAGRLADVMLMVEPRTVLRNGQIRPRQPSRRVRPVRLTQFTKKKKKKKKCKKYKNTTNHQKKKDWAFTSRDTAFSG
jgi:hypothetical protein